MVKKIYCLLPTAYCLLALSCGNNSTENLKNKSVGFPLYEAHCVSCHGSDGKLCVLGAKDLSVSVMTKEQMTGIITNGKSTMTPFSNIMTPEEISSVADHVQTLKAK